MADVHEPQVRSYNMSQIRSKNTKPEIFVRKYLHSQGIRYRLHVKTMPGRPDLVLPRYRTVIFIHGCFWHGHEGCKYFVIPQTNRIFWKKKIEDNKLRDKRNVLALKKAQWKVIEVWECKIKSYNREKFLQQLLRRILANDRSHH